MPESMRVRALADWRMGLALDVRGSIAARAARLLTAAALGCAALAPVAWATAAPKKADTGTLVGLVKSAGKAGIYAATATSTTASAPNGAQPGTVAPGSTVATGSVPTTTTPAAQATGTTGTAGSSSGVPPSGASGPTTIAPSRVAPGTTSLGVRRRATHKSKRLSSTAIVLAALGALLLLVCSIWAAVRWLAFEPRWSSSMMYSLREASYHASATWAEFSDWARIGH